MARNKMLLEMRGIVKNFPGVRALKGVDFSGRRGSPRTDGGERCREIYVD